MKKIYNKNTSIRFRLKMCPREKKRNIFRCTECRGLMLILDKKVTFTRLILSFLPLVIFCLLLFLISTDIQLIKNMKTVFLKPFKMAFLLYDSEHWTQSHPFSPSFALYSISFWRLFLSKLKY